MIVNAYVKALKELALKPVILIPVFISILFGRLITQLTAGSWQTILETMLLWQSTSESPFIGFLLSNPLDILIIVVAAIVSLMVSVITLGFLARTIKGQKTMEAVNDAVTDWGKALAISITLSIATVIFVAIGLFIVELGAINELLSFILMIVIYIIAFFAFVKLVFVFPAMVEEKKAKEAFQTSWFFVKTYSAFAKALAYLILIFIGIFILDFVVLLIGTVLLQAGITDELIMEYAIPIIEDTIITSFAGLAIASYFFEK